MKKCGKCKKQKPKSEFYKNRSRPDGLTGHCKKCHYEGQNKPRKNAYKREWNRKNSKRAYGYWIKNKFGITIDEYDQMLKEQKSVCAICLLPEQLKDKNRKIKRLAVDHSKKTGKVRALLCNGCNRALGYARENPEVLRKLAEYIELHESVNLRGQKLD